jgi:succinate dehydrogenase / fumarate reductase flavoprotein subunit
MSRNAEGLRDARQRVRSLREEFWQNLKVVGHRRRAEPHPGEGQPRGRLPGTGRTDDRGRPQPDESCGGHFREEFQTEDGEAKRDDANYAYVAAWEYKGAGRDPELHKEELVFENVKLTQRSYK